MRRFLLPLIVTFCTAQAPAQNQGYPAFPLLSAQTNVVGETIAYPATGPARVTAAIVVLAPGEKTIVHRHGAPMFAYILAGELTVDYGSYGTRRYTKGQAFMEAMAVAHSGQNTGAEPVQILAVSIGAEGTADVLPANDPPRP